MLYREWKVEIGHMRAIKNDGNEIIGGEMDLVLDNIAMQNILTVVHPRYQKFFKAVGVHDPVTIYCESIGIVSSYHMILENKCLTERDQSQMFDRSLCAALTKLETDQPDSPVGTEHGHVVSPAGAKLRALVRKHKVNETLPTPEKKAAVKRALETIQEVTLGTMVDHWIKQVRQWRLEHDPEGFCSYEAAFQQDLEPGKKPRGCAVALGRANEEIEELRAKLSCSSSKLKTSQTKLVAATQGAHDASLSGLSHEHEIHSLQDKLGAKSCALLIEKEKIEVLQQQLEEAQEAAKKAEQDLIAARFGIQLAERDTKSAQDQTAIYKDMLDRFNNKIYE
jgi:hypothetical protein